MQSEVFLVNEPDIEKRIAQFKQSLEEESKPDVLKLIMSMVDLTTLEGNDTEKKVQQLGMKAIQYRVAAVCVYPGMVGAAKKVLKNSDVKVASVAGGFPGGMTRKEIKISENTWAVNARADDNDIMSS